MQVTRTIAETRTAIQNLRQTAGRVGLVPTMGALHRAHVSLIEAARAGCDAVAVSIFVNPTQFAPGEDYERYPRSEEADLALCAEKGVALVFAPAPDEMYPPDARTRIHVDELTTTLCGPHRPGHFDGVATIVAKLLNVVQPDAAFFGEKDAQQLAVIRRMVRDLDFPVEIVGCPTVREPDGLAVSSRNVYLSPEQRVQARSLYAALSGAAEAIALGSRSADDIEQGMRATIEAAGPVRIDYASVVDADTLQPVERIDRPVLLALAVHVGRTRLIDNISVDPRASRE